MLAVGSRPYPGAAYLSCAAAGRVGAGLVTGAVPQSIWPILAGRLAEPTWLPLQEEAAPPTAPGSPAPSAGAAVAAGARGYSALVLGCGIGSDQGSRGFVEELLRHPLPPTLIDADGLNCLAGLTEWPARLPADCVLTPHPAEMARLCRLEVGDIVAQRWALAREMAAVWGCVVLLKGPYTVVAHPVGWLGVLPVATPALATAGSGDVLAGAIGGLLAQGLDPWAAACTGAWLHGEAGLACEREIGTAGVIASDLLARLPAVMRAVRG
jgi:NAD(P)H-hydrate epimerase